MLKITEYNKDWDRINLGKKIKGWEKINEKKVTWVTLDRDTDGVIIVEWGDGECPKQHLTPITEHIRRAFVLVYKGNAEIFTTEFEFIMKRDNDWVEFMVHSFSYADTVVYKCDCNYNGIMNYGFSFLARDITHGTTQASHTMKKVVEERVGENIYKLLSLVEGCGETVEWVRTHKVEMF